MQNKVICDLTLLYTSKLISFLSQSLKVWHNLRLSEFTSYLGA